MRAVAQRDTAAELRLRSALHGLGLRFRVDAPPLLSSRRRADVVFSRARLAVYVDGCFWHRCPEHGTIPKTNTEWWEAELNANVARDRATNDELEAAGWLAVRIWEHEVPEEAALRVQEHYSRRLG